MQSILVLGWYRFLKSVSVFVFSSFFRWFSFRFSKSRDIRSGFAVLNDFNVDYTVNYLWVNYDEL